MIVGVITSGLTDRGGRSISLRPVDEHNWREVADIAPRDDQRDFVAPTAARYLLLSTRENDWTSLGVYADEFVVGHVMWAVDDDRSHWIGGLVVAADEQSVGIGRAVMQTMVRWLAAKVDCDVVRLSYGKANTDAARLYADLGFTPTGAFVDDEIVVELRV